MNKRIEELLKKYWEAQTSVKEELELRQLLKETKEGYRAEKDLFLGLDHLAQEEPTIRMPTAVVPIQSRKWVGWAASIALVVGAVWGYQVYENKQAEEQAYRDVMQAFAMIQNNFNKGQNQIRVLNDFKYLNTPNELFSPHLKK